MEANGRPPASGAFESSPSGERPPRHARRITLVILLMLLLPVIAAVAIFPALSAVPFESVDEIDPAELKWFSVRLLNRTELDGGGDVGPYYAAPEDYAALLAPLKAGKLVEAYPDARGPWLGEYRIMTTTGRRATIRMYWHKNPSAPPNTPAELRYQMGAKLFEGGTAVAVVAAVEAAQPRGKAGR